MLPITSIADELQKLQQLLGSGTLSHEEFAQAKTSLLAGNVPGRGEAANNQQLAELRLQNELLRIDRDWQCQRDHHKVSYDLRCESRVPSALGTFVSLFFGLFALVIGIGWMSQAAQKGKADFSAMTGLAIIAFGIGLPVYHSIKYSIYKTAYAAYQRRRSEILAVLAGLERS